MINDRKNQTLDAREEKYDLLSGLLSATQGEFDGESQLTDSEVLGELKPALARHEQNSHQVPKGTRLFSCWPVCSFIGAQI